MIYYDRTDGLFRDSEDDDNPVPRDRIQLIINQEIALVTQRLQAITKAMASGGLSLGDWESQFAAILKDAHLQMAAFGAGGAGMLRTEHYQYVGFQLREEYESLLGFIAAILAGGMALGAALRRAGMYAESIRLSHSRAEWLSHNSGLFEGARSLSVARHCQQCPDYDTNGQFLPADQLVPIGHDCDCRRNCKCFIVWRRRGLSALSGGLLAG